VWAGEGEECEGGAGGDGVFEGYEGEVGPRVCGGNDREAAHDELAGCLLGSLVWQWWRGDDGGNPYCNEQDDEGGQGGLGGEEAVSKHFVIGVVKRG
jgi:hypothetical protein